MSPSPVNFASDNSTGAAPEVLAALIAANDHRTMPYGNDHHTRAAETALAEVFECDLTASRWPPVPAPTPWPWPV